MTVLAFAAFTVALLAMVITHYVILSRHEDAFRARQEAIDNADEGRRQAVYQQQKAAQKTVMQSETAVMVLADQTRALHEDIRHMHARVDSHFADPRIKRVLGD